MDDLLPDITRSHHGGNAESEAANTRLHEHKETMRLYVLEYIDIQEQYGATADEVAAAFDSSHNHVAPRMSELLRDGRLVRTKRRRETRAGNSAAVVVTKRWADDTGG